MKDKDKIFTVIFLVGIAFAGECSAAQIPFAIKKAAGKKDSNWAQQQVVKFRTYPHLDRAYRLIAADRLPEAKKEIEFCLMNAPQDMSVWMTYVIVLYRLEQYAEVVKHVDIILREQPEFVTAVTYRGLSNQHLAAFDAAIKDFQDVNRNPKSQESDRVFALNMIVDIYIQTERFPEALLALEDVKKVRKDFQVLARQGVIWEKLGKLAEAEKAYAEAMDLALEPKDKCTVLRALAEYYQRQEEWRKAETTLETATKLDPHNPDNFRAKAQMAYAQKDYNRVIRLVRQISTADMKAQDRELMANSLYSLGRFGETLKEYNQLVSMFTDERNLYRVHMARGYILMKLGKSSQAVLDFAQAVKLKSDLEALMAQAQALESSGRKEEAIAIYNNAAEHYSAANINLHLGMIYAQVGNREQAILHLAAAVQGDLQPEQNKLAYKQLGYLYYEQGSYDNAKEVMEKAFLLDPKDATVIMSLGEVAIKRQSFPEAVKYFKQSLALQETLEGFRKLSEAYVQGKEYAEAAKVNAYLLEKKKLPSSVRSKIAEKQSAIYSQLGQADLAAKAYRSAIVDGEDSLDNRQGLGIALFEMGQWYAALKQFSLAYQEHPSSKLLIYIGRCYVEMNKPGLAIHYLSQAEEQADKFSDQELVDLKRELGYLYQAECEYAQAEKVWDSLLAKQFDPKTAIGLAKIKREQGKLAEAEAVLAAIPNDNLAVEIGAAKMDELAQIYFEQHNFDAAIDVLLAAEKIAPAPERQYLLGSKYLEHSLYERALPFLAAAYKTVPHNIEYIESLGYVSLKLEKDNDAVRLFQDVIKRDSSRVYLYDEVARLKAHQRKYRDAVSIQTKAYEIAPTVERKYYIGVYQKEMGQYALAIKNLEEVSREQPNNIIFQETLGYAYLENKQYDKSTRIFESLIERDPDPARLYKELGYIEMQNGNNSEAVKWFKRVIDSYGLSPKTAELDQDDGFDRLSGYSQLFATDSLAPREEYFLQEGDVDLMKEEIRKLSNNYDFSIYQVYRSDDTKNSSISSSQGGGVVSSQGGMEFSYRPPGIGLRDERTLQLVLRTLWDTKPGTLKIDDDSLQGGAGVLYKPLKFHNIYLGVERLFSLGRNAQDDWLLKGLYSWSKGTELKPRVASWNYTSLYSDVGLFLSDPTITAFYGEVRQGWSFNLHDSFVFTPHLVLNGRWQDPDPDDNSYSEGGGGLSIKYLFGETQYETKRFSTELLIQYKARLDESSQGVAITSVTRF